VFELYIDSIPDLRCVPPGKGAALQNPIKGCKIQKEAGWNRIAVSSWQAKQQETAMSSSRPYLLTGKRQYLGGT
jgi:hypothetical protein